MGTKTVSVVRGKFSSSSSLRVEEDLRSHIYHKHWGRTYEHSCYTMGMICNTEVVRDRVYSLNIVPLQKSAVGQDKVTLLLGDFSSSLTF